MFARRILPCFDEPEYKAAWRLAIVAPAGDVALANSAMVADKPLPDGRHEVQFADIDKLPSYLFAIAVGPFDVVDAGTMGRNKLPVRVVVESGDRKRAGVVAAKLPAVVAALERYFDEAVPLAKLDLVAVPRFFGAMENPGLVTFVSSSLVGDAADRDFAGHFVRIAAHELAHQWFGNSVTPAWWDDLWLAETFANWLEMKVALEVGALDDPALRIALDREKALAADDGFDAKPLRRKIASVDDAEDSFDAIAYEKGTALVETFESWLGADKLTTTMRTFVRAHAGTTVTAADFLAALAQTSGDAASRAFAAELDRTGAPVVELALHCEGHEPRIDAHARDIAVPICIRTPAATQCALVDDRASFALSSCPAWVVGNAGGTGYYQVAWAHEPAPPIAAMTPGERLARGDDLAAAFERGDITTHAVLAELRTLASSRDVYAKLASISIVHAVDAIVDDRTAPKWMAWLGTRFADRLDTDALWWPQGHHPKPGDGFATHVLRDEILAVAAVPAKTAHDAREAIDHELADLDNTRPGWLEAMLLIAAPSADRALYDHVVTALKATKRDDLRELFAQAFGSFGASFAAPTIESIAHGDLPWLAGAGYFEHPVTRTAAWHALRDHLPDIMARTTGTDAPKLVEAVASMCDADSRAEIATAFEPRIRAIPDGRHALDRALAEIDRCIARRERAGDISRALD
jgi:aminopeptidase N